MLFKNAFEYEFVEKVNIKCLITGKKVKFTLYLDQAIQLGAVSYYHFFDCLLFSQFDKCLKLDILLSQLILPL